MNRMTTWENVEISINIKTAKNGNEYASGAIIIKDEAGKFQASIPYISWSEVQVLSKLLRAQESSTLTGGDLAFDGEDAETRERKPLVARPTVTVSGWLTSKSKDGFKPVSFVIESIHQ